MYYISSDYLKAWGMARQFLYADMYTNKKKVNVPGDEGAEEAQHHRCCHMALDLQNSISAISGWHLK